VSASVFTDRVGLDAHVWVGEQGSPEIAPRKLLRSFAPLGGRGRVRPHVSSLVEFTTDSIEQEDARGLVKIDQMRKTLSTGDHLCPFDRLSGS
jgi:hypothetical protein